LTSDLLDVAIQPVETAVHSMPRDPAIAACSARERTLTLKPVRDSYGFRGVGQPGKDYRGSRRRVRRIRVRGNWSLAMWAVVVWMLLFLGSLPWLASRLTHGKQHGQKREAKPAFRAR
jgi:hypothetical protein